MVGFARMYDEFSRDMLLTPAPLAGPRFQLALV
jgi:hypothetical protein